MKLGTDLYPLFACVLLCGTFSFASAEDSSPAVGFKIADLESSINGVEYVLAPILSDLIRLWGKPDRIRELVNDVRIWDDLGIRTFSGSGSTLIDSLAISMQKQDGKVYPTGTFSGKIQLPKGTLTSKTTVQDLQKMGFKSDATLKKFQRLSLIGSSFLVETSPKDNRVVAVALSFE